MNGDGARGRRGGGGSLIGRSVSAVIVGAAVGRFTGGATGGQGFSTGCALFHLECNV